MPKVLLFYIWVQSRLQNTEDVQLNYSLLLEPYFGISQHLVILTIHL